MATVPAHVDRELWDAAEAAGAPHGRSAAQQLAHWSRIGRALEVSPTVVPDAIARVLAGKAPYDGLSDGEQAIVRASWDEQMAESIAGLEFTARLRATGRPWSVADAEGNVVIRDAGPSASGA